MDTKSFELLIHSQYAFDVCRPEIQDFEDCRQTGTPLAKDPALCKEQSKRVVSCYKTCEYVEPICLDTFNDARECLFKADGNMYNCKDFLKQYAYCQSNPLDYKGFLEASTSKQKQPKRFDFWNNRGYFDQYA